MKPSQDQKDFVEELLKSISGFSSTNDITSPSHITLIEEFLERMEYEYEFKDKESLVELRSALRDIYLVVRNIKRKP